MVKRKNQKRRNERYQVNDRRLRAKDEYKDTIFRMLYRDKENLLSLYNAVNDRNYTNPDDLQIVTLENALYQRLVIQKSLYSTAIKKIPTPRFIVFYNGTKKVEDRSEFRLSSAYENPTEDPDLELRVTMLNVNDGHNNELMEHCRTLKEYAQYVARVRKYAAEPDIVLEEAVERAVEECIKEGILAEFLMRNRAEVIKVSIYEYDREFEEKKLRKAEYEAGRQDGIEIGEKNILQKLIKKRLSKGMTAEEIADDLDEDVSLIRTYMEEH